MSSENRDKRIEIRLTKSERITIEKKARKAGLSASEFLRKSALQKNINSKFSQEELEAWRNLTYISNSLKNLNNILSKENREELLQEIRNINVQLKKEIGKFLK